MGGNTALLDDIKTAKKNITITSDSITSAHTTFANQVTSFLSLTGQLDDKIKELEEREIAVERQEHEARAKVQQLEERERKCVEKEKEIEERDKSVRVKELKWNETEKQMEENAAKLPNVIHFNVSGKRFSIEKEKLLQHKGSLFEQMINSNHPPLLSNSSESRKMFINRDSKLFGYIAQFLVLGEFVLPSNAKEVDLLAKEFKYFNIPFPFAAMDTKPNTHDITLYISGTKFTIPKKKMLQHKGSLFESIAINPQQFSSDGIISLARDPKLFKHIVQFIVHGKLTPPLKVDVKLLQQEFDYFWIPFKCPIQSVLLEKKEFGDRITEWLPHKELRLLYRASENGFGAADFHRHCDNKGSTLTLICSKDGYLFGGYSVLPWDSTSSYKNHPEGFIFTLSNPHNIPPTKYPRNPQNTNAIFCHPSYGPAFAGNCDIAVASNSNQNNGSFTNIGGSYVDLTGKGQATFTGAYNFTTSDIEVFAVL